MQSDCFVYPDL